MTHTPRHIDRLSAGASQISLDALYHIAPGAFTEAADPETGAPRRVVDFDALRELLGGDAVEGDGERYAFTWVGKRAPPTRRCAPCPPTPSTGTPRRTFT